MDGGALLTSSDAKASSSNNGAVSAPVAAVADAPALASALHRVNCLHERFGASIVSGGWSSNQPIPCCAWVRAAMLGVCCGRACAWTGTPWDHCGCESVPRVAAGGKTAAASLC